jgi:ribosomal protein S18
MSQENNAQKIISNKEEPNEQKYDLDDNRIFSNYELTILCYNQYNDEVIKKTIDEIFTSFNKADYRIDQIDDVFRYDIIYRKGQIKVNMISLYFRMSKLEMGKLSRCIYKQDKIIIKHMLIRAKNHIYKNIFDYKKPINMKKHLFESQRMMPKELNRLNKKQQKILSKNIKRARVLGLFGISSKGTK